MGWSAASTRRARPKSMMISRPRALIITFAGFRSRWINPWQCSSSRARARVPDDLGRSSGVPGFAVLDPRGERPALDVSHRQEGDAVGLADVVDLAEIRVVEPGGGLGLAEEPLAGLGPDGLLRVGDLQRHVALEMGIVGQIDRPHPTPAERPEHLVAADRAGQPLVGHRRLGRADRAVRARRRRPISPGFGDEPELGMAPLAPGDSAQVLLGDLVRRPAIGAEDLDGHRR